MSRIVENAKAKAKGMLAVALIRTNTSSTEFGKNCGTHKSDISKMQNENNMNNNVKLYQLLLNPNVFKQVMDQAQVLFGDFMDMPGINGDLSEECMEFMKHFGEFIKEFDNGHVSMKTQNKLDKAYKALQNEAKAQRGK
jgi:hypothetical protein